MPARCTLDERAALLAKYWDVHVPEGPGPFPVVIQLHGCGGKKPFQTTWAEVGKAAGAAVIVVDSLRPRGISRLQAYALVCTGAVIAGRERAGDLFAAMAWARKQGWADPNRIIAAGWSHGGWTINDALTFRDGAEMRRATGIADLSAEPLEGLAGTFLVYPYLALGTANKRPWRLRPRTHAIIGGKDSVAGGAAPRKVLAREKERGCALDITFLETATHAFDEPEARDVRVRYDSDLTARAHALYADFIRSVGPSLLPPQDGAERA